MSGELKEIAESCISIRPNFTYSLEEVKENLDRVFSSGFFEKLDPGTEDTRDGVKLVFNVRPFHPLFPFPPVLLCGGQKNPLLPLLPLS